MLFIVIIVILVITLAAALSRMLLLKRDIRQLADKLSVIAEVETNAKLTTDTFDSDITDLVLSINKSLEHSRRALLDKEHAEAALKRAVTNISHDLRTPLTSALGYLQMIQASRLDEQTKTRYLGIITERLEALSALMNNLFELTRIIEGNINLDMRQVNICNLMRDILAASYAELDGKGFIVEANIPEGRVMWLCDEDALRRVLQNLIKNVCVHGREYLRITVNAEGIEIANKANNLSELDTQRIFERFYTADASRTSKNTGLGLAIAKEFMEKMNGRIYAHTENDMFVVCITS